MKSVIRTDPGALNLMVGIAGLTVSEAKVVLANLPADSTATVAVTQPPVGGKRYTVTAADLSSHATKDLITALCLSTARVADQGSEGI
jgi:hypothetical protein